MTRRLVSHPAGLSSSTGFAASNRRRCRRAPRWCAVSNTLETHRMHPLKQSPVPAEGREVKKILVVDDSESVRARVRQALTPAGFEVVEATNGVEGWSRLQGASDIKLVLCDVHMPEMTGLELLVKARENDVNTPIVMLTSEALPSVVKQARESGAK